MQTYEKPFQISMQIANAASPGHEQEERDPQPGLQSIETNVSQNLLSERKHSRLATCMGHENRRYRSGWDHSKTTNIFNSRSHRSVRCNNPDLPCLRLQNESASRCGMVDVSSLRHQAQSSHKCSHQCAA